MYIIINRVKKSKCTYVTFSSDTILTKSAKNLNDVVSFKSSGTEYSFRSPNATSIPSEIIISNKIHKQLLWMYKI